MRPRRRGRPAKPPEDSVRQVSVSMPQAMWERLHVRAGQKGVSLSWLIRALILAGVPEDKGGPLT